MFSRSCLVCKRLSKRPSPLVRGLLVLAAAALCGWLLPGRPLPAWAQTPWRSALYPADWTPGFTDAEGRFLHDFSYAGYHRGEKPLPKEIPGPRIDVTKPPYNADNTGQQSATLAIQRAINDAGLGGGGTVYLPAGTYRITFPTATSNTALIVAHSNVVIQGDGPDKTFLFLDETYTRGKTMIAVQPVSFAGWSTPRDGRVQRLRADAEARDVVVYLEGEPNFQPGEWVVVQYDLTDEWIAEHNMTGGWDSSIPGPSFYRQVTAVDPEQNSITLDTPMRYAVKVRDNGRVYRVSDPITEVGLADFAFGMREHPATTGWGDNDHSRLGTGAYDVHTSRAISFRGVVNGWVRDLATYKPEGNTYAHIHSVGLQFNESRNLTIRRVRVENPQYRGGGGNGYPFVVGTQESLYDDLTAINGRHNFTISGQRASGNVIFRSRITNPINSLPADFHAYLSMANLIDNLTIERDRFDAGDRSNNAGTSGFPKHGVTTTHSVFWNTIGLAYRSDSAVIIRSDQYGWGYVIGTRGPAPLVDAPSGNPRTAPRDYVEGMGRGASLEPQSLYLDQLRRRLEREGKAQLWEIVSADLLPLPEVQAPPPAPAAAPSAGTASPSVAPSAGAAPAPALPSIATPRPLPYDEGFESAAAGALPQGWGVITTTGSTDTPRVEAPAGIADGKVLALTRTAGSPNVTNHAYFTFPPATKRLVVSFDMFATSTRRALRVTLGGSSRSPQSVHGSTSGAAIFIAMNAGIVRSLLDAPSNTWADAGNYSAGRWHTFTFDIDIAAQTFDVYIDGSPVKANAEPIPFHQTEYGDLNTIAFAYQSVSTQNNTAPVYIDNVRVWGE